MSLSVSFRPLFVPVRQVAVEQMIARTIVEADLVADAALKAFTTYPPTRPGSSYQRDFSLARGWKKEVSNAAGGYVVRVINRLKFVRRVQGPVGVAGGQALVHRGRWISAPEFARIQRKAFNVRLALIGRKYGYVVGGRA